MMDPQFIRNWQFAAQWIQDHHQTRFPLLCHMRQMFSISCQLTPWCSLYNYNICRQSSGNGRPCSGRSPSRCTRMGRQGLWGDHAVAVVASISSGLKWYQAKTQMPQPLQSLRIFPGSPNGVQTGSLAWGSPHSLCRLQHHLWYRGVRKTDDTHGGLPSMTSTSFAKFLSLVVAVQTISQVMDWSEFKWWYCSDMAVSLVEEMSSCCRIPAMKLWGMLKRGCCEESQRYH